MAVQEIRAVHLNRFYQNLAESGIRETAARAIPKADLRAALKEKKLSMAKVARRAGVGESTGNTAGKEETRVDELYYFHKCLAT